MLLPLFGFIIGCLVFGIVGVFLLKVLSSFKLTTMNLAFFILGALPGALMIGGVYGWIFANPDGQLDSTISVLGLFTATLVGGGFAGLVGVRGGTKVSILLFPKVGDDNSKDEV